MTDPTPMPPLVSTFPFTGNEIEELRRAFLGLHEEPSLHGARRALLIERFVVPDLKVYDETKRRAERVEHEGEPWP
jgi:hypothetical protein